MQKKTWIKPTYVDVRLGMEVTMYVLTK
ncbi:MAG: pyrroloquinoline quinone precursor peptide PqqA [Silvanigrellales bacterium]|nr:pyrroloquinoline quinone precursor peptide PqqA [Silvanigrellales bacterium]